MKKLIPILIAASIGSVSAQSFPSVRNAEDKASLTAQSQDFFKAADAVVKPISKSSIVIKNGNRIVAFGTVTEAGILTKWSEISNLGPNARIVDYAGKTHSVITKKVYKEHDLAVLNNPGKLPALKLRDNVEPEVGDFLIASGSANQAIGLGVVSVKTRNLKQANRGFLGVIMEMNPVDGGGVKLSQVQPKTAAADAGLKAGDIILTVDGKAVNNLLEMRNFLQKQKPGDEITMSYNRAGVVKADVKVVLGARKEMPAVRASRMRSMKSMGGRINKVAESFPEVLQTDIQVKFNQCGAPVVDLDGKFVGVVISRSSRIKSYVLEADTIKNLLKTPGDAIARNGANNNANGKEMPTRREQEMKRIRMQMEELRKRMEELEKDKR